MNKTLLALALGTLAGATTESAIAEGKWYADFDEAAKVAQEEGKDLFVDFTGSDWCGWCIKLHEEVFDHEAWIQEASKDYVFVALDFPRSDEAKALVPNPERNEALQQQYGVRGFPTIFLMTADGIAYAQTGYQAGGPEKYVEHMNEIATAGKKAMEASKVVVDAFTAAEGDAAKWAAWDDLVAAYAEMPADSPFTAQLVDHVRWGMDTDKDNAAGKQIVAVEALVGKGIVDDTVTGLVEKFDPKNEKGMLEKLTEARFSVVQDQETAEAAVASLRTINELGFKDTELGFNLNLMAAGWCAGPLQDEEGKMEFAKKAEAIGTEDEDAMARLKELLG